MGTVQHIDTAEVTLLHYGFFIININFYMCVVMKSP
jgi:hypothetical protein